MTAILTPVQNAALQTQQIFTQSNNMTAQIYQRVYNAIWNPPANAGYTTASLLADFGTNAASILAALAAAATYITALGATVPIVSGAQEYTANQDGTVTLS